MTPKDKLRELLTAGKQCLACLPNSKKPAHKWRDTPLTLAQLDALPDTINAAICPEDYGWCVIDADLHKPGAREALDALRLPETYTVATPSGGVHLYFLGSLPPTTSQLGVGIDTRGRGSIVLIPPSTINGKSYDATSDRPIAVLPPAIHARFIPRVASRPAPAGPPDRHRAIDAGRTLLGDLLRRGGVAIGGRGGNNTTYQVAARLVRDCGLAAVDAHALMMEPGGWNDQCQPPWSPHELGEIIEHAVKYGQQPPGSGLAPYDAPASLRVDPAAGRFLTGPQMHALAPPAWILPGLIPLGAVVLVTAPKASFKTFLAVDIGMSLAHAVEVWGETPARTGPVYYGAHEGILLIQRPHREAWLQARNLPADADIPFYVGPGPRLALATDAADFRANIHNPCLVIIDTYSQCMMSLDENDPGDVYRFITYCHDIVNDAKGQCSVLVLAHTGKDITKGTRGSNSLEAAVDTVIGLERVTGTQIVKLFVRFQRGALERAEPLWLRGEAVGDSLVFSLRPYEEPHATADLPTLG